MYVSNAGPFLENPVSDWRSQAAVGKVEICAGMADLAAV